MWEHMKGATSMCRRQTETQPFWAFCPSNARFRWQICQRQRAPEGSISPVHGTLLPSHFHFSACKLLQFPTRASFLFINCISEPSTTRDTLGLFPFSHVIHFVFSWQAISFSHHSITYASKPRLWVVWSWQGCASPLLPARTDERERMRMEMRLTAWTQTVVCIYPQPQQQQLLRDLSETVGGKLKATRLQ